MPDPSTPFDVKQSGFNPGSSAASSVNPFEPASSLPGAPRTGGGASQTDMVMTMLQRNASNSMATYMLAADARSRAFTAMMMKTLAGGMNAQKFMASDQGKLAQLAVSAGINSGAFGLFNTGGNMLDMGFGASNMAGGGLRSEGGAGLGGGFFAGRGAVTDLFTKKIFDRMNQDFFNEGGASRLQLTHGMDRGQLGQIMTHLSQSGAFSGMNIGGLTQLRNGQIDGKLDETTIKKMFSGVSGTAGLVHSLSDITGNKNVGDMMRLATQATGISFADANAPALMQSKIDQISQVTTALGLNKGSLLSSIAARGGGPLAQSAVVQTAALMSQSQQRRVEAAKRGMYLPELDRDQMETVSQTGMTAAAEQEKDVGGAAWLLQNSSQAKAHEHEIRSLMTAVGQTGDMGQRAGARDRLRTRVQELTGQNTSNIFRQMGGSAGIFSGINPGTRDFYSGVLNASDQSEMLQGNIRTKALMMGAMNNVSPTDVFSAYAGMTDAISPAKQQRFMSAIAGGDTASVQTMIQESSLSATRKTDVSDSINKQMKHYGGPQLAGALGMFGAAVQRDPWTAGHIGAQGLADQARLNDIAAMNADLFGSGTPEDGNPITNALRGIVGGENLSDTKILQAMVNGKDPNAVQYQVNKTAAGGFTATLDDKTAKALSEIPGVMDAMGVKDAAGVKEQAGTEEGYRAMRMAAKIQGMGSALMPGPDGTTIGVSAHAKDMEATRGDLQNKASAMLAEHFGLSDKANLGDYLNDPKNKAAVEKLMEGKGSKEQQLDYDAYAKGNSTTEVARMEAAIADKEKLAQTGTGPAGFLGWGKKAAAEEAAAIRKKKDKITDDEASKGTDLIGTVKLIMHDGMLVQLWKNAGSPTK